MGKDTIDSIVSIATALVGLAILSVLVSSKANTPQVIGAATSGFASDLEAATSPVTGSQPSLMTSYAAY